MSKDYYLEISENKKVSRDDYVLPSERPRGQRRSRNIFSKNLKWAFFIFLFVILYFSYDRIMLFIFDILKTNPTIYSYYLYAESQISNSTLTGLFFIAVFGSLFFLVFPSEALFIYYLSSTNHFFVFVIFLMVLGNLFGMLFNYLFGRLLGERILRWFFGDLKFNKYQMKIDKYGGLVLLFGNILPGPIEVLALFYGGFKFKFVNYVFLVFMGRLIKFLLLFVIFYFFWDQFTVFYSGIVDFFSLSLGL